MQTFFYPLLGGLCIGISASLLLWFNGRISGVSGIYWDLISWSDHITWRLLFIVGLPIGVFCSHFLFNQPIPTPNQSWFLACVGGLLVGVGVKIGSGCTSGHGVCGIGRLSIRSLVSTLIFMCLGIGTVFLVRWISL